MRKPTLLSAAALCLAYTACVYESPKYLKVASVRFADTSVLQPDPGQTWPYLKGRKLIIVLSSTENIGLVTFVYTWLCGQKRPEHNLYSQALLDEPDRVAVKKLQYQYITLLEPDSPPRFVPFVAYHFLPEIRGYDLRTTSEATCLQTETTGCDRHQSNIVVIPSSLLHQALEHEGTIIDAGREAQSAHGNDVAE